MVRIIRVAQSFAVSVVFFVFHFMTSSRE